MPDVATARILQITAGAFPPEIRVLKEARTFREAGFDSAVMCPPISGRPAEEHWEGIRIFRPAALHATRRPLDKVLYQSLYYSPAWSRAVREVLASYRPDVIHVHDIWLARTVFTARRGGKIVLDLHENMPAAVEEYLKGYRGGQLLFNGLFKRRPRVLKYERRILERSDLVLAVVEEAGRRILSEHPSLDPTRVAVVENLESKSFLTAAAKPRATTDDLPTVLYVGGFGPHRGIDTMVEAMRRLKDWGVPVRLDLIGAKAGSTYAGMIEALIDRLDVRSHVQTIEWVPADQVPSLIQGATIGTVPHHSNAHTDNTIPHKLYQYMIAGTPVLVSTSAPLARTVRAAEAGAVFQAGNAEHCAHEIRALLADPDRLARCGANGRAYVLDAGHNWEHESAPSLLAAYRRMGIVPLPASRTDTLPAPA